MVEQVALGFGGLLRQLRTEAGLTQEELAEAAGVSPRSVSDLERGINRTARKDTAELLAGALGLAEPTRGLFVAAALGRGLAVDVLAARNGRTPGTGHRVGRWARGCPYRGLLPFGESDAEVFYGRERLAAKLAAKLATRAACGGLVVVTGASGSGSGPGASSIGSANISRSSRSGSDLACGMNRASGNNSAISDLRISSRKRGQSRTIP